MHRVHHLPSLLLPRLRLHNTLQIPLHRLSAPLERPCTLRMHNSRIPLRLFRMKRRMRRTSTPYKRLQQLRHLMRIRFRAARRRTEE